MSKGEVVAKGAFPFFDKKEKEDLSNGEGIWKDRTVRICEKCT